MFCVVGCRRCQALGLDPANGRALRCLAEVYRKAGLVEQAFAAAKVPTCSCLLFFYFTSRSAVSWCLRQSAILSLVPLCRLVLPGTSKAMCPFSYSLFAVCNGEERLAVLCPLSAGRSPSSAHPGQACRGLGVEPFNVHRIAPRRIMMWYVCSVMAVGHRGDVVTNST